MMQETRTKMKTLKLTGALRAWDALVQTGADKDRSVNELLAHLIDAECEERYVRKVGRRIERARLRLRATVEEFDCSATRGINRTTMANLSECEWVTKAQNIIITGATGTGKSYLACALAHLACTKEHRVIYYSSGKLIRLLRESQLDHSFGRVLKNIARHNVLVLDDFGLDAFGNEERRWLLEALEDRYGIGSTIIASQFPTSMWQEIIGDATIADAIIDRLIHHAQVINLEKEATSRRARHR